MEPETIGVLAAVGVALTLIGFRIEAARTSLTKDISGIRRKLDDTKNTVDETLSMHEHPDDHDFGTREVNRQLTRAHRRLDGYDIKYTEVVEMVRESTRATKDLTRIIKFSLEKSGHPVPPLVD